MYITCVILCLFSALSHRVDALQISIIIIINISGGGVGGGGGGRGCSSHGMAKNGRKGRVTALAEQLY